MFKKTTIKSNGIGAEGAGTIAEALKMCKNLN